MSKNAYLSVNVEFGRKNILCFGLALVFFLLLDRQARPSVDKLALLWTNLFD